MTTMNLEPYRVREMADGQNVTAVLLVHEAELRDKKDGGKYLRLQLGDRTGRVEVKIWDIISGGYYTGLSKGDAVYVVGTYKADPKYGAEIKFKELRRAEQGEVDWDALLDGPARSIDEIQDDFKALIASIENEDLVLLLKAVFDKGTWSDFRQAPAAKRNHHGYRHGLLEHTLQVGQLVAQAAETVPGLDRDVAVTGAILHDIGKIEVYTDDLLAIDYTTEGKLAGEIPLSYYRLRRVMEGPPALPPDLARAILHIVMSHHGTPEHGSPARPATREAVLVHFMDNLSARLGTIDRLEKELPAGEEWSSWDKVLSGSAFFPQQPLEDVVDE